MTRPSVVGRHAAEGARIADPDQVQRDVRVGRLVGVEDRAQVGAAEHVAVEHHHVVRRAAWAAHCGYRRRCPAVRSRYVVDLQAQLGPVTEVSSKTSALNEVPSTTWLIPRLAIRASRCVRNGRPGRRQHRLGRREGQRTQPRALAADEDDRVGPHSVRHRSCPLIHSRLASTRSGSRCSRAAPMRRRSWSEPPVRRAAPTAAAPATSADADRPGSGRRCAWCAGSINSGCRPAACPLAWVTSARGHEHIVPARLAECDRRSRRPPCT